MKKILVVHTGGTIAMKENKEMGTVSLEESHALHSFNHVLSSEVSVLTENLFHIPSPHITPSDMIVLYNYINKRLDETKAEGVVITHGTDTLEETAYMLDLLYEGDAPLVMTGAMRAGSQLLSDGPHNFVSALQTAVDEQSQGKGVLVVINDDIHTARDVTKTNTTNIATFTSPNRGPIGRVQYGSISYFCCPNKETKIKHVSRLDKKVLLLKMYAGLEEETIQSFLSQPTDGLVIEALGSGNVPPAVAKGIQSLLERDTPVVLTSRCGSGSVQGTYDYEGGGYTLKEAGVIFAGDLQGVKARLKLIAALESGASLEHIKRLFERD